MESIVSQKHQTKRRDRGSSLKWTGLAGSLLACLLAPGILLAQDSAGETAGETTTTSAPATAESGQPAPAMESDTTGGSEATAQQADPNKRTLWIKWEATPGADTYRLTLATDPKFDKSVILTQVLKDNKIKLSLKAGQYFVKIEGFQAAKPETILASSIKSFFVDLTAQATATSPETPGYVKQEEETLQPEETIAEEPETGKYPYKKYPSPFKPYGKKN